jgi:hypothetical protein
MNASLLLVDQSGTIVNTVAVLTNPPSSGGDFVWDAVMDQDGDYVALVAPGAGTGRGLVRIARSGFQRTSIHVGAPLVNPLGLTVDVETGDLIVLDNVSGSGRLWRFGPSGTPISTLANLPAQSYGWQVSQLAGTGDYYVPGITSTSRPSAGAYRVTQAGAVTTFLGSAGTPANYGIAVGRSSPLFPRLALGSYRPTPGIFLVDLLTQTTTTLHQFPSYQVYAVAQNRGRNVATQKVGSGQWAVLLSFPSEPGNGYAAALSLSGTRPGFPLPGNRHVSLNVDILTQLSLDGTLVSIFKNNIGSLNTQGEAQAILDVSKLPPLTGVRIWIQAITQNPQAPSGIATVADPVTLLL